MRRMGGMRLVRPGRTQLPHVEGVFGVTFKDMTKDAAFYTSTSRFVAWLGTFPQVCRAPG